MKPNQNQAQRAAQKSAQKPAQKSAEKKPEYPPPSPEPLPRPVIDNHCHLDVHRGPVNEHSGHGPDAGVRELIDAAVAVNVTKIVQIGCDLRGARWAVTAAAAHDELIAGVALHPNTAARIVERAGQERGAQHGQAELSAALAEIETLASAHPKVRAVGETGLDYFRTGPEGHGVQAESFRFHIDLAKRLDKTLVIHDRDSHDDILKILDAEGAPSRWVMHCFSGDAEFAEQCLARGAYLSFAGPVTFPANQHLRAALAVTPDDKFLVETDAPYLTPVPFRGRTNASYLVPYTVRAIAEIRQVDLAEGCDQLTANTFRAFGGPW